MPSPTWVSTRDTLGMMTLRDIPVTSRAKAMFASAVRSSNRRKSWKTIPSLRRRCATSRRLASLAASARSPQTSPCVGRLFHVDHLQHRRLPAPLGPVRKQNSPFLT